MKKKIKIFIFIYLKIIIKEFLPLTLSYKLIIFYFYKVIIKYIF